MDFGNTPSTSEEVLRRTQDALAEEIGLMLEEGVVAAPEDIDLCMILGAGWPMHRAASRRTWTVSGRPSA